MADQRDDDSPPLDPNEWRPSEVLFAFAGWLTSRRERIVMGHTEDATPAAKAVTEFCERHHLRGTRRGWHLIIAEDSRQKRGES